MKLSKHIAIAAAASFALLAAGQTPDRKPHQDVDPQVLRTPSMPDSMIVHKVLPAYPPDAIDHKIQGVVKIGLVIGKDGRVEKTRLISGHPLLAPTALQAVRQWVFQPSQMKGNPVRVITSVEIPFMLDAFGNPVTQKSATAPGR